MANSWRVAADVAKRRGISVEHIGAVLPAEVLAVPSFARRVLLKKSVKNYRKGGSDLPTYGEMFRILKQATGSVVMYTNSDIAVVPDFYIKLWEMMQQDLTDGVTQRNLLETTRATFYHECERLSIPRDASPTKEQYMQELCARDAIVYFENQGGRTPHWKKHMIRFFCNKTMTAQEVLMTAYDRNIPDTRMQGNAMTITRRQFPNANASEVLGKLFLEPNGQGPINEAYLQELYRDHGVYHPGNDLFAMPRRAIPRLLTETAFVHLRPSGFLIGELLKNDPKLVWRRVMSSPKQPLTFHVGMGTDEWPERAKLQPRQVLFEAAQYFDRLNSTKRLFWPPAWCSDGTNYRSYGTERFCGSDTIPGDYCRGMVRLLCTSYWHHGSRDRMAYNTMCYQVSKNRQLETPFCEFCNDVLGGSPYKCTGKIAVECGMFPCS